MAKQKKGCGFLIAALAILIIGGGISAFLASSAVNTAQDSANALSDSTTFHLPAIAGYKAGQDGEASIWLAGNEKSVPSGTIINIKEKASGETVTSTVKKSAQHMGSNLLLGTFSVTADTDYLIEVTGPSAGSTILVSSADSAAVMGMLGKGFGAIALGAISGFIALILGIIGLVKYFGGKNTPAQAPPVA